MLPRRFFLAAIILVTVGFSRPAQAEIKKVHVGDKVKAVCGKKIIKTESQDGDLEVTCLKKDGTEEVTNYVCYLTKREIEEGRFIDIFINSATNTVTGSCAKPQ